MKIGGHHKLDWFKGSLLCILRFFLNVNVHNGDIFGVVKISNNFWGMPDIPDIFFLYTTVGVGS